MLVSDSTPGVFGESRSPGLRTDACRTVLNAKNVRKDCIPQHVESMMSVGKNDCRRLAIIYLSKY